MAVIDYFVFICPLNAILIFCPLLRQHKYSTVDKLVCMDSYAIAKSTSIVFGWFSHVVLFQMNDMAQ